MAARVSPAFAGIDLLVDNSAFQRGGHTQVWAAWLQALEAGNLYRSPILEFEILYSARNAREHTELREELETVLEHVIDLLERELRADGFQLPARPSVRTSDGQSRTSNGQ